MKLKVYLGINTIEVKILSFKSNKWLKKWEKKFEKLGMLKTMINFKKTLYQEKEMRDMMIKLFLK